jgi:hypothetical protein
LVQALVPPRRFALSGRRQDGGRQRSRVEPRAATGANERLISERRFASGTLCHDLGETLSLSFASILKTGSAQHKFAVARFGF